MRRAVLTVSPAQLLDLQWPRRALPLCSPTSRSCAHGSTRAHTVLSPEKDPPYKCCQGHQHWLGGRQKQCRRWPANVDTRDGWRRWYLPPACHTRHREWTHRSECWRNVRPREQTGLTKHFPSGRTHRPSPRTAGPTLPSPWSCLRRISAKMDPTRRELSAASHIVWR